MKILFVCMGNICRSPTVEDVARRLAAREVPHLDITFDSAGTAGYHIGEAPDRRSQRHALARGYDISGLRARRLIAEDFRSFDLLLAMDEQNLEDMLALAPDPHAGRARLFLSWLPAGRPRAVPDPYYGNAADFERVLDLAEEGSRALLAALSGPGR